MRVPAARARRQGSISAAGTLWHPHNRLHTATQRPNLTQMCAAQTGMQQAARLADQQGWLTSVCGQHWLSQRLDAQPAVLNKGDCVCVCHIGASQGLIVAPAQPTCWACTHTSQQGQALLSCLQEQWTLLQPLRSLSGPSAGVVKQQHVALSPHSCDRSATSWQPDL